MTTQINTVYELPEGHCEVCNEVHSLMDICSDCGICGYQAIVHEGICDDCLKNSYYKYRIDKDKE